MLTLDTVTQFSACQLFLACDSVQESQTNPMTFC